jgi:UDP-2,3-diacylglucosamine pyrophosphatase LpxH
MISDLHYVAETDEPSVLLIERLIDKEKPDFVMMAGDCLSGGGNETAEQVKKAVANVSLAVEKKQVPWAMVFGNHDQEHAVKTGMDKEAVLDLYAGYPHNYNKERARGLTGAGNANLLIWDSAGKKPVFSLWLIDSGDAAPQDLPLPKGTKTDDWIRTDQIVWYWQTSRRLEEDYGRKIPGLMFFHIPLPEFREMSLTLKTLGVRNEQECFSKVNSGMFAAVVGRGDVKGIFCGHDHENNYIGDWMGVKLGYDAVAGYKGYPHIDVDDPRNDRYRGGRVFVIDQTDPWHFKTWMRFKDGSVDPKGAEM